MIETLYTTNAPTEPWQWFYFLLISLSVMLLCFPITIDWLEYSRKPPFWLISITAIDILLWGNPYGWFILYGLHMMFLSTSAPITAKVIVLLFSLLSFYLTVISLFLWTRRR